MESSQEALENTNNQVCYKDGIKACNTIQPRQANKDRDNILVTFQD